MPEDSLAAIDHEVVNCRLCPRLVEWREQVGREKRASFADQDYWARPVPSFGDPDPWLLIVGLAPAAHGANRTGRMFTGDRSGDFLFAALHRTGFANQPQAVSADDGLELTGCRVTAPVRCAPPANKPTRDERQNCAPYLDREFALFRRVKVVMALGGIGWDAVLSHVDNPPRPKPKFGHGAEARLGDWKLLGTYHPSQQNTFTGRLTPDMFDAVLNRAREVGER